jgi:hypothetical protein
VKRLKRTNKWTWIYECNFITLSSPTWFGHSCGHLQGKDNKNLKNYMVFNFGVNSTRYNCMWILVLTTLKMTTWVAENVPDDYVIKLHSYIQVHLLVPLKFLYVWLMHEMWNTLNILPTLNILQYLYLWTLSLYVHSPDYYTKIIYVYIIN